MGLIRNIALVVLSISCVTFIALFGRLPALRNTPIGAINRLLCLHIPKHVHKADVALTGGLLSNRLASFGNYLFFYNHPIVMVTYLLILTSAATMFLTSAWHRMSFTFQFIACLLVPLPYIFTYLCNRSRDSTITQDNYAEARSLYPFDHSIYHPGMVCYSCKWEKPPRSKHCNMCDVCVSKCDHHCMWVANCVGYHNYHYFMGLLVSLGSLLLYGAFLGRWLLVDQVTALAKQRGQPSTMFNGLEAWSIVIKNEVRIGAVGLLAALTCPLAWALFWYHVYLIWAGMTTNETDKWQELRMDMREKMVWKGRRPEAASYENCARWPIKTDQILIRQQGGPPRFTTAIDGQPLEGWSMVRRLTHVQNLYDLGFWDNVADVMHWL